MASITTILSTDSLASSRIVLNGNFSVLNGELNDVVSLLNPDLETLSLTGNISASGITLATGGTTLFSVSSSEVITTVPLKSQAALILENGLRKSVISGATQMPPANGYVATTYILDATASGFSGTVAVNAGDSGQDVTFISSGGTVTLDPANIAAATAVSIQDNGALTLRFYNNTWYVISEFNCTIVL